MEASGWGRRSCQQGRREWRERPGRPVGGAKFSLCYERGSQVYIVLQTTVLAAGLMVSKLCEDSKGRKENVSELC